MKIGVISNSELCLPLLNYLKSTGESPIAFLSCSKDASINKVVAFCDHVQIPVEQENGSKQAIYKWLIIQDVEIVFIIGYKRLLHIDKIPAHLKIFNIHFGDLPTFRGPNPVFWQLKKGSPTLCVSIHQLSQRYDTGPLVWKKEIRNEDFYSYGYAHQLLSHQLIEGVAHLVNLIRQKQEIALIEQQEADAVYYPQPILDDVLIQWNAMSAKEICDLVRSCNPWNLGAIALYNGFEVKIIDAAAVEVSSNQMQPGYIIEVSDNLHVSCINGEGIKISMLNINGLFVPGRFSSKYGFQKNQKFTEIKKKQTGTV